jgi:hypothetical protein
MSNDFVERKLKVTPIRACKKLTAAITRTLALTGQEVKSEI